MKQNKNSGRLRLSDKAYTQIRELIVSMQLRPGEQVEENVLEQRLSIGRTPIREALQRLATDGLLDHVPGRGLFVRPISIDDVKSLFEAMTALEQVIVQLTTQRIRPKEIDQLAKITQQHKKALADRDYLKATYLNIALHQGFCEAARNSFLLQAMKGLHHQSERLAYLTYTNEACPVGAEDFDELAIDDHERLLDCFRTGNAAGAVEIITDHCRRFFLRVCHYMEPRASLIIPQIQNDLMDVVTSEP